ncbi:MAG: PIG-L deacetylase family protein [Armatimonadota bacterium]
MNYQRVLVFGAHPDDELVMAPAMAKFVSLGVEVVVAMMTDGCEGYPSADMKDTIVEVRRQEQEEADRLLGTRRVHLARPDMGLVNDKQTLLDVIRIIREVRPDAIFTHGHEERHRDHLATHHISLEAAWQGGEPVSTGLGEPWITPHLWYYKNMGARPADLIYDVTGFAHYRQLSLATQVSQHVLFGRDRQSFEAEAEQIKQANQAATASFWMTGRTALREFPEV